MRLSLLISFLIAAGCGAPPAPPSAPVPAATPPADAAHKNVTGPHGDHTPRHGGLVLMFGDVHYEVVLNADGRHAVWFSDAVRNELPASVAREVTLRVARPGAPEETLALQIDGNGEAWIGKGTRVEGDNVMVKVRYVLPGEPPHETEIPFLPQGAIPIR
jgi:hypothetical protein